MAIKLENQRQGSVKITGLGRFKVLGFNLTKAELEKLGVNLQEEPKALQKREIRNKNVMTGEETTIITDSFTFSMWIELQSETVTDCTVKDGAKHFKTIANPIKGRIFRIMVSVENRPWVSQSGKTQYLNGVGKSSWAMSTAELPDWFKTHKPIYPALKGAAQLYEMILAWTNIDITKADSILMLGDDENSLKSIFTPGDNTIINELNHVAGQISESHSINALIGIDGEYMQVYNGMILPEIFSNKQTEKLYNTAVGEYGFKGDFQNALMLQTYDPMASINAMTQNTSDSSDDNAGESPDDLPF
jgi:hypothetical protein